MATVQSHSLALAVYLLGLSASQLTARPCCLHHSQAVVWTACACHSNPCYCEAAE